MRVLGVGMVGCGVVGGGVLRYLGENAELLAKRTGGLRLEVRKIGVRNVGKKREGVDAGLLTGDWREVVENEQVDIVLELMGGTEDARAVVEAAIRAGKPVVTANKALLAEYGAEICGLAQKSKVPLYFEASVAGGVPIIKALRESLRANDIRSIHGIINGTCNYILTRMAEEKASFESVLAEAKERGYAEADESLDVDGIDAAHKAAILASISYGFWIHVSQVYVEGIRNISELDFQLAEKFGYTIKLLAIIKKDDKNNTVNVRVHPTLIPKHHVLASITGAFNAVAVEGDVVGHTLFYGKGAGADATASAVLSDLFEAAIDLEEDYRPLPLVDHDLFAGKLLKMDEVKTRYYLRLTVVDQPGVLAQIASIFGKNKIGISSVFQPESCEGGSVPLVLMSDFAKESVFQKAVQEINALDVVQDEARIIRVEDFS